MKKMVEFVKLKSSCERRRLIRRTFLIGAYAFIEYGYNKAELKSHFNLIIHPILANGQPSKHYHLENLMGFDAPGCVPVTKIGTLPAPIYCPKEGQKRKLSVLFPGFDSNEMIQKALETAVVPYVYWRGKLR